MTSSLLLVVGLLALLASLHTSSAAKTLISISLADRHPINPWVYGVNFATQTMLDWGVGVSRNSGDAASKYNWKIDYTNSADDYYWETGAAYHPFQPANPPGTSFVDGMLNRSIAASSVFINPVNVLGWVVKSRDPCYSFSVAQYGPQQQAKGDAGNGILTNGTFLSGNWHCFERYGLAENVEWLQHIEQMVGKQAMGKNLMIQLGDNEPDCFNPVHRDVHPLMFGFDELWESTLQFGSLMRRLYPDVHLNGPSWSNWCWYWWVRGDGCGGLDGTDFQEHGSIFTNMWLMKQVNDYYLATGVKLMDSLDVHYYPESIPSSDGTPAQQQAYLDEVRSLWDPTYKDPGSIGRCGERCLGPAVALLPRLREMVAYAPNVSIAYSVSEYAWGFNDGVYTAALAVAEVMAVMGQWNALMSARWVSPAEGSKAEQAYKVFLNYDGQLSKVAGDSVNTSSSASPQLTAYTVYNATQSRLFLLAFNRELDAAGNSSAVVQLTGGTLHSGTSTSAAVYEMTPTVWQLTRVADVQAATNEGGLTMALDGLQPRSLTLVVVDGVVMKEGVQARWWEPEVRGLPSVEEMMEKMKEEGPVTAVEKRGLEEMGDSMRARKHEATRALQARMQRPARHMRGATQ